MKVIVDFLHYSNGKYAGFDGRVFSNQDCLEFEDKENLTEILEKSRMKDSYSRNSNNTPEHVLQGINPIKSLKYIR